MHAFYDCISLTSVTIPNSVISIDMAAFRNCSNLSELIIPSSVTSIGGSAFYGCSCLNSIIIPGSVKTIGGRAFQDCDNLSSLSIGEGVLNIMNSAFEGCKKLATIVIPSTVNAIGLTAFKNCRGLTDVYCYAIEVPATDESAFQKNSDYVILHVPATAVDKYKRIFPWSDFEEIVALDGDVTDGIMTVKKSDEQDFLYYDLTGRKVSQPHKGIYIRNGNKIVVK